jgi:hypothetical protein
MEISSVLVQEHVQRLREAAQAPSKPLVSRVWAIVRRRQPAPVERIHARELERLAA